MPEALLLGCHVLRRKRQHHREGAGDPPDQVENGRRNRQKSALLHHRVRCDGALVDQPSPRLVSVDRIAAIFGCTSGRIICDAGSGGRSIGTRTCGRVLAVGQMWV